MSNNKYKILVIEDEANIQNIIETILESNGYQVLTAGTCAEGKMSCGKPIGKGSIPVEILYTDYPALEREGAYEG